MSASGQLPVPVRRVLDDAVDDATVERVWRGVARRRARRTWLALGRVSAVAAAAAALLGLGFVLGREAGTSTSRRGPAAGALALAGGGMPGDLAAADGIARRVSFADGSSVTVAAGTRARVTGNDAGHFVIGLASGEILLDVTPHGPRHWTVDAGSVRADVLGTRFTMRRDPRVVAVRVERGAVAVTARGEASVALAGTACESHDGIRLACGPTAATASTAPETRAGAAAANSDTVASTAVDGREARAVRSGREAPRALRTAATGDEPSNVVPQDDAWRGFAAIGEFRAAYDALGPGGVARVSRIATARELLVLADVARRSGHPAEATAPLERIVDEMPHDANAPLAAFTLGVVYADSLHDTRRAAAAFERAIAAGVPSSLRADALARLALALDASGDGRAARAQAERYVAEYPAGTRRAAMERLIGAPHP